MNIIIVYIIFALIVVGITGINTTDGAILGLANVLGNKILILGSVLGILTMTTSFIAVAFALIEMYRFDYKLKNKTSSILTCFIPMIIAMIMIHLHINNAFFKILDITGTFGGSLEGILIVFIWWKAKKLGDRKPEYVLGKHAFLGSILMLMFVLGMVYQLKMIFF